MRRCTGRREITAAGITGQVPFATVIEGMDVIEQLTYGDPSLGPPDKAELEKNAHKYLVQLKDP